MLQLKNERRCKVHICFGVIIFKYSYFFLFLEIEDAKKTTDTAGLQSPPSSTGSTPDYAAGLTSTPTYAPATPQPSLSNTGTTLYFTFLLNLQTYVFVLAPGALQNVSQAATTVQQATPITTTTAAVSTAVSVQYATAITRPVPPLLSTASTGQRAIVSEQPATAIPVGTPVVLSTRPVQQVTQIRIQPQPAVNSLQRRGLALTV